MISASAQVSCAMTLLRGHFLATCLSFLINLANQCDNRV